MVGEKRVYDSIQDSPTAAWLSAGHGALCMVDCCLMMLVIKKMISIVLLLYPGFILASYENGSGRVCIVHLLRYDLSQLNMLMHRSCLLM